MDLLGKRMKEKFGGKNEAFWDNAQRTDEVFVERKTNR